MIENLMINALFYVGITLLLRSLFFLIKSYRLINKWKFYGLSLSIVVGIIHFMYYKNVILEASTKIGLIIFLLGSAWAFYLAGKSERDKHK